jgi:glycosyltransferase involved in cell wall biosynthesis
MNIHKIPKISIIVPVFNVESFICRCIDSILAQTYTDFELILVNDGSNDNSGIICDEYSFKDERIKVIHKINGGQSTARNAGIDIAKGIYVNFIDADDYIDPAMIETLYSLSVEYAADISECGFKYVYGNKEITCEFGNGIEYGQGNYLIEKFINADIFYGVWSKLFRKSLFDKTKFPDGRIYEDTWMTLNFCLSQLSYVRTQQPLYYYNQTNESTLRSIVTQRKAREFIYILESQLDLIDVKISDNTLKQRLHARMMEKSVIWHLDLALSGDKTIRHIYSKLFLRRMNYSIFECFKSVNIPFKNKITYLLCKTGLTEVVRLTKIVLS